MSDVTVIIHTDAYDSNSVTHPSIGDIAGLHVKPTAFLFETKLDPQSYFWTGEWQQGERDAEEDFAMGNTRVFTSIDDAIGWLDSDDE